MSAFPSPQRNAWRGSDPAAPARASGGDSIDPEDDVSLTFPQRLMEILDKPEYNDIICWLPHGHGFVVFRKKTFESKILPKHFYKHSKYPSFTRKLNRWGFVRVTRGPETGAYFHPCFRRGDYRLVMQMSCSNITTKNKTEYWLNKRAPPIGGYSMLPLLSQSAARDELNARESSLYPNLSLQAARTAEAMFTATKQQHQQEEPLLQYHFVQQQRLLQQELMLRQLATSNSRSQYQHLFPSPEPRLGGLSLALNTTLTSQRLLSNTSNMTIDQHPALLLQQFRNNQGPTVPNSIRSLLAQLKQQRLPNASPNFFE